MTFLSHVGSDRYGVYPLRGKIKNIRDVKTIVPSVLDTDSRNIAAALGIKAGCEYEVEDISSDLRYGHVLIMTDQVFISIVYFTLEHYLFYTTSLFTIVYFILIIRF